MATVYMPGQMPDGAVDQFINTLKRIAPLDQEQEQHIRERRTVTSQQWNDAKANHDRFEQDKSRVRQFFDGNMDVRKEVVGHRIVLKSTVRDPS
jgi:hypothetical protein